MELLGEDAINSIAEMCGVSLKRSGVEEEEEQGIEDQETEDIAPSGACDNTKYIIRRGKEEDVLRDVTKRNKYDEGPDDLSRVSDYTYDEFVREFEAEVTTEDVFEEDARAEAEHEILDGGTFEVGRIPDKQYLTLKVKLPDEDLKTIDIDVKSDRVIVLSHRYKCRAYWPGSVRAAQARSTWSPDTGELRVRAPVSRMSADLRF